MPATQTLLRRVSAGGGGGTTLFGSLANESNLTSSTGPVAGPWMVSGTFRNFKARIAVAPGGSSTLTWTLNVNGVDTALKIIFGPGQTTGENTADSVAIVAGDLVCWKQVVGGVFSVFADLMWYSLEFFPTSTHDSAYVFSASLGSVSSAHNGIFTNSNAWQTLDQTFLYNVVAAAGDLTSFRVDLGTAPGSGKNWAFSIIKNGVTQDGTLGSVNATVTISDSSTTGTWNGTLPMDPGDKVSIIRLPTNTPALGSCVIGYKFVADTAGESQFGGCQVNVSSESASPRFCRANIPTGVGFLVNEGDVLMYGATSPFVLKRMQVVLGALDPTNTHTLILRQNQATSLNSPTISTNLAGSDLVHELTLEPGDTFDLQHTSITGGGRPALGWAWVLSAVAEVPPPPPATGGSGCPITLPVGN